MGQIKYIYIFSFNVCAVWFIILRWWCCLWCYFICVQEDQCMVYIATKTFIVYMCITYVLCIYVMDTRPGIYFYLDSLFPSFLYSVMLIFSFFFPPWFCLVLRTVVSSSLIKENCLNEFTDVNASDPSCFWLWDMKQKLPIKVFCGIWLGKSSVTLFNIL